MSQYLIIYEEVPGEVTYYLANTAQFNSLLPFNDIYIGTGDPKEDSLGKLVYGEEGVMLEKNLGKVIEPSDLPHTNVNGVIRFGIMM